jgi:hypothetical protein
MHKEMPVIQVNKVVNPKRMLRRIEGRGGGEAQGVAGFEARTSRFRSRFGDLFAEGFFLSF